MCVPLLLLIDGDRNLLAVHLTAHASIADDPAATFLGIIVELDVEPAVPACCPRSGCPLTGRCHQDRRIFSSQVTSFVLRIVDLALVARVDLQRAVDIDLDRDVGRKLLARVDRSASRPPVWVAVAAAAGFAAAVVPAPGAAGGAAACAGAGWSASTGPRPSPPAPRPVMIGSPSGIALISLSDSATVAIQRRWPF